MQNMWRARAGHVRRVVWPAPLIRFALRDLTALDYPQIQNLRLGTSSWSSQDWVGVFYPPGTASADFISEYAKHFDTVEVDSTFYRTPPAAVVRNWHARTPAGFLVAAKFPQVITHEKVLVDCAQELSEFLKAMEFLNNHYAGFAPGSIKLYHKVWERMGATEE